MRDSRPKSICIYHVLTINIAMLFGIYRETMGMIFGTAIYSKSGWKGLVWKQAWQLEDEDWELRCAYFTYLPGIQMVMDKPSYMIWWRIADQDTRLIREYEVMVRIVCRVSDLRCDDYRLKGKAFSVRSCTLCDNHALEDSKHFIMQCPYLSDERDNMFHDISNMHDNVGNRILDKSEEILWTLLGRPVDGVEWIDLVNFWIIVATHVYKMYRIVMRERAGIG